MKYLLWYLVGAGAVYGGYYYYTKVMKRDLCINDLTEPFKTQVLEAVKANDSAKLLAYASQSTDKGWNCAAGEMRAIAVDIDKKKPLVSVPISEIRQNINKSLVSNPLTTSKATGGSGGTIESWATDKA